MSDNDRPELRAFKELESLVRNLGEELAVFRRRAIAAEGQIKDGAAPASAKGKVASTGRVAELEEENAQLKLRLERAEDHIRQMMERVRFLRQQVQTSPTGIGAGRP